jgi:hypothetical protein
MHVQVPWVFVLTYLAGVAPTALPANPADAALPPTVASEGAALNSPVNGDETGAPCSSAPCATRRVMSDASMPSASESEDPDESLGAPSFPTAPRIDAPSAGTEVSVPLSLAASCSPLFLSTRWSGCTVGMALSGSNASSAVTCWRSTIAARRVREGTLVG